MLDVPLRPSSALVAYAEPHIDGRRVLVLGDATSGIAEQLLERGARLIHVYDPDPARVAEAATRNTERRVSLAPLSEGGLAAREGAFDCAIVEDLSSLPHRVAALRALRRALSPRGIALIASPNPDSERRLIGGGRGSEDLDYYGLYDAVAAELDHVRMLGQTPFVGYAIVDFAPEGEPEPSFDNGFVPGGAEEPEQYIALASQGEVRLDDMTIVQLPLARVSLPGADEGALSAARNSEKRAQKRVAQLETELKRTRQSDDEASRLKSELDRRDSWIRELENRAAAADSRADDAETELEALRERLAQDEAQAQGESDTLSTLREELDEVRRVASRTQREREWAEERVRKLQDELETVLREAEEAAESENTHEDERKAHIEAERARWEAQLRERDAQLRESDAKLRERETQLRGIETQLRSSETQLKDSAAEAKRYKSELDAALSKLEASQREGERQTEALTKADKARRHAETELERVAQSEESRADVAALEAQLVLRGKRVAELEGELRKLERYGRELVLEVGELRQAGGGRNEEERAELQAKLDQLARVNAAHEANLVAADWAIAELRDRLAGGQPPQVTLHRSDA
jgi:septal ring factor EnvC (AmiA/AmiB activator)